MCGVIGIIDRHLNLKDQADLFKTDIYIHGWKGHQLRRGIWCGKDLFGLLELHESLLDFSDLSIIT